MIRTFATPVRAAALALALLAAEAGAWAAGELPPVPGSTRPVSDGKEFIERSRVLFPNQTRDFILLRSQADREVEAGVALRYQYGKDPEQVFDIFVYPAGQLRRDQARTAGLRELRASFAEAERAGLFRDIEYQRDRRIELRLSKLQTLQADHVVFSAKRGGVPAESHAVLLYRHFYYTKLRASGPKAQRRILRRLVAAASRQLLPQIRVQSVGDCMPGKEVTIQRSAALPKGADPVSADGSVVRITPGMRDKDMQAALLYSLMLRADSGCVASFDAAGAAAGPGEGQEWLEFKPGTWTSEPAEPATGEAPAAADPPAARPAP